MEELSDTEVAYLARLAIRHRSSQLDLRKIKKSFVMKNGEPNEYRRDKEIDIIVRKNVQSASDWYNNHGKLPDDAELKAFYEEAAARPNAFTRNAVQSRIRADIDNISSDSD